MLKQLVLRESAAAVPSQLSPLAAVSDDWSAEVPAIAFIQPTPMASNLSFRPESAVIAQQFDQDVLGDFGNAFSTFYQSGQIWALIIGIVIGYLIRGMTTYN